MIRWKLIVAGVGFQEFQVSRGTTAEPARVDLLEIERGKPAENNHIEIRAHVRLYPFSVYQYRRSKSETGEPGPETSVDHAFYPLLSAAHPFVVCIPQLKKLGGGGGGPQRLVGARSNTSLPIRPTARRPGARAAPDPDPAHLRLRDAP